MDQLDSIENVFPSTTWEWRRVKVRRPPEGHSGRSPKARRFFHLPPRDPRVPLNVSIKYRGGPEAWYEIHARGTIARYPGWVSIDEIMAEVNRRV